MVTATVTTDVCLFDLDGTIVNTTKAVEQAWVGLCTEHNVDPKTLYEHSHGTRTVEVMARFFPDIDNTDNKGALEFEASISRDFGDLVVPINGHSTLLNSLDCNKWCIVTSGNQGLAHGWFGSVLSDVKKPDVFITADMVTNGKPHPEGYLTGAQLLSEKLGLDHSNVKKVVFEDAPVGIGAGLNAGALVIGIASGFDAQKLYDAGATYVVKDLSHVRVVDPSKIELEIDYIEKA